MILRSGLGIGRLCKPAGIPQSQASTLARPIVRHVRVSTQSDGNTCNVAVPGTSGFKVNKETPCALDYALGALAACEQSTALDLARQRNINIRSMNFDMEATLDVRGYRGVPGVPSQFQTLRSTVLIDADATEEQLRELKELVSERCPLHALFRAAGVKMSVAYCLLPRPKAERPP
eukprot:tig00021128_g18891.t1